MVECDGDKVGLKGKKRFVVFLGKWKRERLIRVEGFLFMLLVKMDAEVFIRTEP